MEVVLLVEAETSWGGNKFTNCVCRDALGFDISSGIHFQQQRIRPHHAMQLTVSRFLHFILLQRPYLRYAMVWYPSQFIDPYIVR